MKTTQFVLSGCPAIAVPGERRELAGRPRRTVSRGRREGGCPAVAGCEPAPAHGIVPRPRRRADLEEIGDPAGGGQNVAAIEAKCSMGGADDFSESAADATVRVARITQRDKVADGGVVATREESLLPVVDALPLVMAIWSERTI
jgi:hypothetical protein